MGTTTAIQNVTVCPGCDIILATAPVHVPYGSRLVCPRCNCRVKSPIKDTLKRTIALSLTGLILFIPAHFMLLLTFETLGMHDSASVFDGTRALFLQKYSMVALVVFFTAQVFPLLKLGLLFLVSFGISRKLYVALLPRMLRWYQHLEEWGMSEVYLIGILVTIIKMAPSTRITYEIGFICFAWLVIVMTCISCVFDRRYFWDRIEELLNKRTPVPSSFPDTDLESIRLKLGTKAISAGLQQCHTCHKVLYHQEAPRGHRLHCPRCGALVHKRVTRSVSTTWALVLTAFILCFPANMLPIMDIKFLGVSEKNTIMDGIIHFFQSGSYGIGLIILSASILVPIFKIVGLGVLLYSIHFKRVTRLLQKTVMFRFISFIGRWSMLDIFVIALLCSLVNFGFFTTIDVEPAATFFTFVVLTTMFAAISFDERLLWDAADFE